MIGPLLGFVLALAESGLGLGAVIPGELAISALAAGAHDRAETVMLGVAVALGATAGDHLGYVIGRLGGTHLRDSRLVARLGVSRWDRAAGFVNRFGFWAMFASRLLPVVRTVMPIVAGSAGLPYRTFLLASMAGAVMWSGLWVGAGAGVADTGLLEHPEVLVAAISLGLILVLTRRLVLRRRGQSVAATSNTAT
jgi:membrane-associated protein